MKLKEAIDASPMHMACYREGKMLFIIDGSEKDGTFLLKSQVDQHIPVFCGLTNGLEDAIWCVLKVWKLPIFQSWEPIGGTNNA